MNGILVKVLPDSGTLSSRREHAECDALQHQIISAMRRYQLFDDWKFSEALGINRLKGDLRLPGLRGFRFAAA